MAEQAEYVIKSDGAVVKRRIVEVEVEAQGAISRAFNRNVTVKRPRIFSLDRYPEVGLAVNNGTGESVYSVRVQMLPLRCEFKPMEDGKVMVPKFIYDKASKAVMTITWDAYMAQDNAKLAPTIIYAVYIKRDGTKCFMADSYLYAFDAQKRAYRMPLANLFEDCRLCSGDFDSRDETEVGTLKKALAQFESASWNADLYTKEREVSTAEFFRLKPEKEGFTTLNINAPSWTSLCDKVATDKMEDVVI